ncbi:MAG: formylmethanofuran dehydrogenase subunit E family protein [Sulfurovaceae bacterium]|nr:formylmethanofuran dehydrogenase subunit E family protein [Sulfurovaceae bacterium]
MKKFFFIVLFIVSIYANEAHNIDSNHSILVRDTDSAIGRYNIKPKSLTLDTLVKSHGHLCDGIAIAFVELSAVLDKIFPDGVVDRTDLYVVSKNSPCLVDGGALMTGARINFKTLS